MKNWWDDPVWSKAQAMTFPQRDTGRMAVIVVGVERKAGDNAQPPNDRVRVFVGGC